MFDLTGRTAVVTGAVGLLGQEFCDVLAEAGANVVVADLDESVCREYANALAARRGIRTVGIGTDIGEKQSVELMAARALEVFGRIDILVNNAALTAKGGSIRASDYFARFEDYSVEVWEKALRTNLTGAFLCSQIVGREFVRVGAGVIVNICSTYGLVGPDQRIYEGVANPYGLAHGFNTPASYSTTKAGVLGLTRYLATYWAGTKIRVNALSPGGVREAHDETFVKNYVSRVPLGRMAERTEFRGALLFLASDASSYMTGANLVVDGGWTAW